MNRGGIGRAPAGRPSKPRGGQRGGSAFRKPFGWATGRGLRSSSLTLTFSSSTNAPNILSLLGNPSSAVQVAITVNAGVTVGSTGTSVPALDLSVLPSGSKVTLLNNGTIEGAGGDGGAQGTPNGGNGGDGGTAIKTRCTTTITNNGGIWGGGGGGGGAGQTGVSGGGRGGGGAGVPGGVSQGNGVAGTATTGGTGQTNTGSGTFGGTGGNPGHAGANGDVGGSGSAGFGGAGGKYIDGIAFTTFAVTGDVRGGTV